ncbi:MAG: hypothetical protein JWP55_3531 [Mycobacterium sp.]|nr:hypothetical protein [Mycobacterium sp.]
MTGSSQHDPQYASPNDARVGRGAVDSPANPLFFGVGNLCSRLPRPTGVNGVAVAVLGPATHTRELVYATDTVAQRLDELQYTTGEGPCYDAYLEDYPQSYPELDTVGIAPRWPTFAADAAQLGVHAVFAFPLPDGQRPMGVLELYRRAPGALTDAQHGLASFCASAISARLQSNWASLVSLTGSPEAAVDVAVAADSMDESPDALTRMQVHIAAGVVAEQLGISADEAVDRLRAHCYTCGRTLSAVAADIIARRLTLAR